MNLLEITKELGAELIGNNVEFKSVNTDSRTIQKGDLFIALSGPNFDGNQFINDAAKKGAVAAIASKKIETNVPYILVEDTHQALMHLAKFNRQKYKTPIVAVTGSCGKTTTRALLTSVFAEAGHVLASIKSFNNNIGVPLTLMQLNKTYDYVICEMGANHKGELHELTHMAHPNVAIITNAASAHLEGFGSLDGVAKAKGEIFDGLAKGGVAIINNDDNFADYWRSLNKQRQVLTFALKNSADVFATNIKFNQKVQPSFDLNFRGQTAHVTLQLFGDHNIANALAAAAAGFALGLSMQQVAMGLTKAEAVEKRLVETKGVHGATIINDSYNANPLSVSAAISVLAKRDGKSILVLADMKELGDNEVNLHSEIGKVAKQHKINRLYTFGELTRHTAKAFGENGIHFDNREQLIAELKNTLTANDTVLIKGSNSMRMDLVAKALEE